MDTKNLDTPASSAESTIDLDELTRKYDTESRFRRLKGTPALITSIIAIAMSLVTLYVTGFSTLVSMKQKALHLGFVLCLIFILYPASKKGEKGNPGILDYILAFLGMGVNLYLLLQYDAISLRGGLPTQTDLIVGALTMVLVLEAARRAIGKELPILSLIFLAYAYFGPYLPGRLMHRGYSIQRLIEHMFISAEGIYGIPLGVSATYIVLFILFGSFLAETGMSKFFTNLALATAGSAPGGPAKVSVITSALLGMINGSAAANVVTTGTFTIPLMKSVGYKPYFAGAVEAAASTGGQILPPVMGAAAFIMAEFLGIPYVSVMKAAVIPAILYFLSVWLMVDLEARKLGLKGIPKENLPRLGLVLREGGHLVLPIILLVYMLIAGYTPIYAAFYSIVATVIVSMLRKETRLDLKKLLRALENGARGVLSVAIACAVVGFIVGVISLTGLGLRMADVILTLSSNNLYLTLVLAMVACIVLGMGMPTSAAYIVAATVTVPALDKFGVPGITAHLFVLYFAVLSAITPPVALASYAGAGVAGANPTQVGWTAVRLGLAGFIVPFIFVFSPSLLLEHPSVIWTVWAITTAVVGVYSLSASLQGFLITQTTLLERALLFASALLLIKSGLTTDLPGIGLMLLVWFIQRIREQRVSGLNTAGHL
ncbi:MAG: hypothetical protein PWQ86_2027 [Bacillota bacterium]|jgi:TRAP transporter 4TM/12TM fusion protein|nr:hypothetical protein [Bacillota bacterium]